MKHLLDFDQLVCIFTCNQSNDWEPTEWCVKRQLSMKSLYTGCICFAVIHYVLVAFSTHRFSSLRDSESTVSPKRSRWCRSIIDYFRRYPGLPIPFNLIQHRHSTSAYAAAYLCSFNVIAGIFVHSYKLEEAFPGAPMWANVLYMVFAISLTVSSLLPVFISITKGGIIHWSVGSMYCLLHLVYIIASVTRSTCMGFDHLFQKLLIHVPSGISFLYLFLYFCNALWSHRRKLRNANLMENPVVACAHVSKIVSHVRELLLPRHVYQNLISVREQKSKGFCCSFASSVKQLYQPSAGFTYPPGMVWCMCVTLVLQYFLFIRLIMAVHRIAQIGKKNIQHMYPDIQYSTFVNLGIPNARRVHRIFSADIYTNNSEVYTKMLYELIYYWTDIIWISTVLSTTLAMLINIFLVFRIMLNYQLLSLRMHRRGFEVFAHMQHRLNAFKVARGTIIYPSYQISLMVCGFYFQTLIYLTITIMLALIITLNAFTKYDFLVYFFSTWWPGMLLLTAFAIIQQIVIRYVFTQNCGKSYGFDNIRSLQLYIFFSSFYNIYFGLVSGIGRILYCPLSTAICISRLDVSALGQSMQSMDTGHLAFVAFLYADVRENNPTFRVFLWILLEVHCRRNEGKILPDTAVMAEMNVFANLIHGKKYHREVKFNRPSMECTSVEYDALHVVPADQRLFDSNRTDIPMDTQSDRNNVRSRTMWHLAYTLIRNPELIKFRRNSPKLINEVQVIAMLN